MDSSTFSSYKITRGGYILNTSKKILIISTIFFIALIVGGVTLMGSTDLSVSLASSTNSNEAPDFKLASLSGEEIRLSDFRGKPVVLNFWASWCGPCREESPILGSAAKKYEQDIEFLGVAVNDSEDKVKTFSRRSGMDYPIGLDNGSIADAYRVNGIPATFFIDGNGQIADTWVGAISEEELTSRIEELI